MNEEYKQFETVSDSEVFEVASKLMDEFNEAFEKSLNDDISADSDDDDTEFEAIDE